ncbi:hypothetical protein JX266_002541 [Neoarthrinium moseri]|nr:hypothetical protein JX266_002541 [Neoarthrinium moseri]
MAYVPNAQGHRSMRTYFPAWTRQQLAGAQKSPPKVAQEFGNNAYSSFSLSSNWILRPEGLEEFYAELRKDIVNPEVTYNINRGCFEIRCLRGNEEQIVTSAFRILNQMVSSELGNLPHDEVPPTLNVSVSLNSRAQAKYEQKTNSNRIMSLSEWRLQSLSHSEVAAYEWFSYPSEIKALGHRATWRIPENKAKEGMTIKKLFLDCDPVELISSSTGCVVMGGTDGLSLHFGSNEISDVSVAYNKLGVALKYYEMEPKLGGTQVNVLYTEQTDGKAITEVELRYLGQTNRKRYLTPVFLDPTKFAVEKDYEKLFEKGSFVRSVKEPKPGHSATSETSPMISRKSSRHEFLAFDKWSFSDKVMNWDVNGVSPPSIPQTLEGANSTCLERVNPQAAPRVLEWATTLPTFPIRSVATSTSVASWGASRHKQPTLDHVGHKPLPIEEDLMTFEETTVATRADGDEQPGIGLTANRFHRTPIYQSRSEMDPSPQTTNASSQVHQRTPVSRDNRIQNIKNQLVTLGKGTNSATSTPNKGKKQLEDPFTNGGNLHIRSDDDLLGNNVVPSSLQATRREEPHDLLSFSPHETVLLARPLSPIRVVSPVEKEPRQYHQTMKQKAASKTQDREMEGGSAPYIDSAAQKKIKGSLYQIFAPLRIYQGSVTLKAELGRLWFTKINYQHMTIPKEPRGPRTLSVREMEDRLGKHTQPRDLYFSDIVSLRGEDMNYLSNLVKSKDTYSDMWQRSKRRAFYEFWCMTTGDYGVKHYFVLEIDAHDFSYKLRKADTKQSNIYVHCTQRDFDLRLVVDALPDIEKNCMSFAKEVVASLEVKPQPDGSPVLGFVNFRGWGVETKSVRIRQVATFQNRENTCQLHITRVQCMKKAIVAKGDDAFQFRAYADVSIPHDGIAPAWFEAHITSIKADHALRANNSLEFLQEAEWTPESLDKSGAFDDLLRTATSVIKHMDGVGASCDNRLDDLRYGYPPFTKEDVAMQQRASGPAEYYW